MASSTDFKNLWERYQKEGVPKSISKDEEAAWFVE